MRASVRSLPTLPWFISPAGSVSTPSSLWIDAISLFIAQLADVPFALFRRRSSPDHGSSCHEDRREESPQELFQFFLRGVVEEAEAQSEIFPAEFTGQRREWIRTGDARP